jgi:hypothetical protein
VGLRFWWVAYWCFAVVAAAKVEYDQPSIAAQPAAS